MTKHGFTFLFSLLFCCRLLSQSVGIGTATPDSSALLHLHSTSKGILIPGLTEDQRLAISKPAKGLLLYQRDGNEGFYYFNGLAWMKMGEASKALADSVAMLRTTMVKAISDSIKHYSWTTYFADSDYRGSGTEEDPLRVKNKLDSALGMNLITTKAPLSNPQFSGLATLDADTLATLKDVRMASNAGAMHSAADNIKTAATPPSTGNFYFDTGRQKLGVKVGSQWFYFSPTDSVSADHPAREPVARTIRVNFTNQFSSVSSTAPSKWNNLQAPAASLTTDPPTYTSLPLADENDAPTNITIAPTTPWEGAAVGTNNTVPAEGTGLYTNAIITSAWLTRTASGLRLSGLDPGKRYGVYLLTQGTGSSVIASYTISGETKSINAQGNYGAPPVPPSTEFQSPAWVVFESVTATATGEVEINLGRSGSFYQVGIAALILREWQTNQK